MEDIDEIWHKLSLNEEEEDAIYVHEEKMLEKGSHSLWWNDYMHKE